MTRRTTATAEEIAHYNEGHDYWTPPFPLCAEQSYAFWSGVEDFDHEDLRLIVAQARLHPSHGPVLLRAVGMAADAAQLERSGETDNAEMLLDMPIQGPASKARTVRQWMDGGRMWAAVNGGGVRGAFAQPTEIFTRRPIPVDLGTLEVHDPNEM